MAKGSSKKQTPATEESIEDFRSFRRALHAKGDLLKGLSDARLKLIPSATARIVREASQTTIYRNIIVRAPFPPTYNKLKKKRPLPAAGDKVEAHWTASVLALHSTELANYVRRRDAYFSAICCNDYDRAESQLKQIESEFGVSLWLLSSQITFLQLKHGT